MTSILYQIRQSVEVYAQVASSQTSEAKKNVLIKSRGVIPKCLMQLLTNVQYDRL